MTDTAIHFSECFNLDPNILKKYGAFDIALTFDVPVFIDPFRLYASEKKEYNELHERIIDYLRFLRNRCSLPESITKGELRELFCFPEVKHTFMGFCKTGNSGSGLGGKFARALKDNLTNILFGEEHVSDSSHLEKLCVICEDVGRDCISDFTTNLIKDYLAEYTELFARRHLNTQQCTSFDLQHVVFDFQKQIWKSKCYYLPEWNDEPVLLVPKDLLTKDNTWISKEGLLRDVKSLPETVGNQVLKDKLIRLISHVCDESKKLSRKEKNKQFKEFFRNNPEAVDWYIKRQEDEKAEAMSSSNEKVAEAVGIFIDFVKAAVADLDKLGFYKTGMSSIDEVRTRAQYFKRCIEMNDGYKMFYSQSSNSITEQQVQLAFRMVWFGTNKDVNREPNNGRGPVDYKVSEGAADKCLVEFKLASNRHLENNLKNQLDIYKAANDTTNGVCIIVFTNEKERIRMENILSRIGLIDNPNVITIDAGPKTSASKVGSETRES